MNFTIKAIAASFTIALAASGLLAGSTQAMDHDESSVVYYGDAKPSPQEDVQDTSHDRTIEAAAIRKAAEKIGELRGSIDGNAERHLLQIKDLKVDRSSRLGFPVIEEKLPARNAPEGSVPLV